MYAEATSYNAVFWQYLKAGFSPYQATILADAWRRRQS